MILILLEFTRMLSNEIPRSAELEDGSKASSPRRPCSSPSQRRQLDNLTTPTMEDLLIGGVGHRQVLDPLGSAPS